MPLLELVREAEEEEYMAAYLEWRGFGLELEQRLPNYEENLWLYNRDKAVRERGQF